MSVCLVFSLRHSLLHQSLDRRDFVTQWTLGFLVYAAFLTLSKSGSILQQLKTLFIG